MFEKGLSGDPEQGGYFELTLTITLPLSVQSNFTKTNAFCQANSGFFCKMLPFLRKLFKILSGNGGFWMVLGNATQEPRKIGLM